MEPASSSTLSISLSELDLAPDWASQLQDKPSGQVVWGEVEYREPRGPRREGRGGSGGPRRDDRFGGPRPGGPRPGGRGPGGPGFGGPRPDRNDRNDRGPRRDGPPRRDDRGGPPRGGFQRDGQGPRDARGGGRFPREDARPAYAAPPRGWNAVVIPEPAGVENLTLQIKSTGRAYQVFDLARLFISKNERFRVRFEPRPGEKPAPLVLCAVDGSLWLTRDEARRHFSSGGLLSHFFNEEKITVDPPKGVFATVAVCGFSGTVLGPPNFHGYQRAIIQLHQERFKNMPLDRYKSRIRIERDEEAVKKWLESQSTQTHYTLKESGEDAPKFSSADEAARHLLETRDAEIFAEAPSATVSGALEFKLLSPGLVSLFREAVDRQRRFPLELVQELCRQFETQGLRFFKENKKETFVSRSRPRPLDPSMTVSERVKSIVQFIRENSLCTYKEVVVSLVPQSAQSLELASAKESAGETAAEAAPASAAPAEETPHAAAAEAPPAGEAAAVETAEAAPPAEAETGSAAEPSEADREGIAVLQDLRWLIREGYVTEFSNGQLRVVERQEKPIILQLPKRLRLFGRAFTLWTLPYQPARRPRLLRLPGHCFSVWTHIIPGTEEAAALEAAAASASPVQEEPAPAAVATDEPQAAPQPVESAAEVAAPAPEENTTAPAQA